MMDSNDIVVGLDIGTVNVTAVIGECDVDRMGEPVLKVVGVGNASCRLWRLLSTCPAGTWKRLYAA